MLLFNTGAENCLVDQLLRDFAGSRIAGTRPGQILIACAVPVDNPATAQDEGIDKMRNAAILGLDVIYVRSDLNFRIEAKIHFFRLFRACRHSIDP